MSQSFRQRGRDGGEAGLVVEGGGSEALVGGGIAAVDVESELVNGTTVVETV